MNSYIPVHQHSNGKWTRIEDAFPIKNGDIPIFQPAMLVYQRVGVSYPKISFYLPEV